MCKLWVWWLYYIGTSHTLRSPYYEKFCTTKVTILWLYIVQNVQVVSMVTVLYRHKSHITITILWKILYYQGHHTVTQHSAKCASWWVWWLYLYRHKSHITITILWKFCTTKVTTLHRVTSMVTVLYSTSDHHTMKNFVLPRYIVHKCASYEYGDCTI